MGKYPILRMPVIATETVQCQSLPLCGLPPISGNKDEEGFLFALLYVCSSCKDLLTVHIRSSDDTSQQAQEH